VNFLDIAGIGIWALGYDDGYTACWNAIQDKFTTCAQPQPCSGTFRDLGGPGNYYDNEDWTYTIAPPNASQVTLSFSSFSIENNWDFMYIYDGPSTTSPLVGTYTGTNSPGTVTSTGSALTVRFTSDINTVDQGWSATWSCVQNNLPANLSVTAGTCPVIGVTLNWTNSGNGWFVDVSDDPNFSYFWNKDVSNLTSTVCPGSFCDYPNCNTYLKFEPGTTYYWRIWNGSTQTYGSSFTTPLCAYTDNNCSGTIDDSGGPSGAYAGNEDWTYTIAPTNAATVSINFSAFDLELNYDSLYIYDGASTNAPLIGGYTGMNSPGSITSSGGALTLHFISDPFVENAGFSAAWSCTPLTTSLAETGANSLPAVYPNPSSGTFALLLPGAGQYDLDVYNTLGELVYTGRSMSTGALIDLRAQAKGVYLLRIRSGEREHSLKLLIQ